MKRTELRRRSPLARGVTVRRRNEKRTAERHARNFGGEADAVRAMPCLCLAAVAADIKAALLDPSQCPLMIAYADQPPTLTYCTGPVVDAHVKSRGAGGGRFDVVPLCQGHHDEQHACGIRSFAERYGLDLRAEADRIALVHARPLGIRPLAARWSARDGLLTSASGPEWQLANALGDVGLATYEGDGCWKVEPLDTYERDALLGWVRRRMEREVSRLRARVSALAVAYGEHSVAAAGARLEAADREALAFAVQEDLGAHGYAMALCEAAGWPS